MFTVFIWGCGRGPASLLLLGYRSEHRFTDAQRIEKHLAADLHVTGSSKDLETSLTCTLLAFCWFRFLHQGMNVPFSCRREAIKSIFYFKTLLKRHFHVAIKAADQATTFLHDLCLHVLSFRAYVLPSLFTGRLPGYVIPFLLIPQSPEPLVFCFFAFPGTPGLAPVGSVGTPSDSWGKGDA